MKYRIVKITKNNGNVFYIVESKYLNKKEFKQLFFIPQMVLLLWTPLIMFLFWIEYKKYKSFNDAKQFIDTEIDKHKKYIEKKIGGKIKTKEVVFH
jgi:hypothetical protein